MWLSRLDLLAFGKFTNVRLELGPGFHLVVGPNEAGKSTALRAIRQLLFGFDERTPDNFLHANPNLRIGGVFCAGTDLELKVIRRKSRKDSLRGEDDMTAIELDQWNQLLSGVDEATFCQRYGIDYEQLIEGGHQIATGNGDLGEILFATGSGVMDLNKVKQSLTADAEEIFKPQGKKTRLNQSILKWQELKDQVRDKLLSVSMWEETDRIRQEAIIRLEHVSLEWARQTGDFDRLRLLQRARPIVVEIDTLEKELASIGSVPKVRADFGAKRQEAFLLLKQASLYHIAATDAVQRSQHELEKLVLPRELIAHADEISQRIAERGSCEKGQRDRQILIEECDRHAAAIDELVALLGPSVPSLEQTSIVLDRANQSRLGQLGRLKAGFTQSLADAESHRDRVSRQIEEAERVLATIPPPRPLEEFRTQLRKIQSEGDLESRLGEVTDELSCLRESVRQQIDALGIGYRSIEDVIRIRIPDQETRKKFEADFHANQAEGLLLQSRIAELGAEHSELEKKIENLRQEFQVPTEADLASSRQQRTQLWSNLRRQWMSRSHPSEQEVDAFEKSISEADRISDRLRLEADRVAQLTEELDDRAANETRQHESSIRRAQLDADRILLEKTWHSEWPDLKELAPSPGELTSWLMRHEALVRNDVLARRRQNDARVLTNRIQASVDVLNRLLGMEMPPPTMATGSSTGSAAARRREIARQKQLSFGWEPEFGITATNRDLTLSSQAATPPLTELLRQAEERLLREEAAQQLRRETVDKIADLQREQSEFTSLAVKARNELIQWNASWQEALLEIGLSSDSTPDAAEEFIQTLSQLSNHQIQLKQLQERIDGIDRDVQRFNAQVRSLCANVAPDLVDVEALEAVPDLQSRLMAIQREESIRNEQTVRKTQAEEQRILAQETRERGAYILNSLCQEAKVTVALQEETSNDPENKFDDLFRELESIENRARERDVLEQQLERGRVRLSELAGEESAADFALRVRSTSPESLEKSLHVMELELHRLASERDQLNQRLGGVFAQLQQMNGGGDAAEAEEMRQQCLAQIRADAEEYVRLKLASSVLHAAIERYREKIRGPVLTIASQLFRELTLGSFEGLRVDEDDNHKPVLMGIRPGGLKAVAVNGMSEGTCDQLYLALRLASLQLENSPRSDLPLIVDDILVQFDDPRATAALRVLAQMGQQRQVIFFTHHEHLLDLASQHLPGQFVAHRLEV